MVLCSCCALVVLQLGKSQATPPAAPEGAAAAPAEERTLVKSESLQRIASSERLKRKNSTKDLVGSPGGCSTPPAKDPMQATNTSTVAV